jgi:hypothetical protein
MTDERHTCRHKSSGSNPDFWPRSRRCIAVIALVVVEDSCGLGGATIVDRNILIF